MIKAMLVAIVSLAIVMSPFFVQAHVKWFTNITPQKENIEVILSPLFLVLAVVIAGALAVLTQVLPKLMDFKYFKKIDQRLAEFRKYSCRILKYGTAAALVLQVLSGTVFAPEFPIHSNFVFIFIWATIVLLVIPHHVATKLAAVLLLGLFIYTTAIVGVFHMLDYGFYLAIIGVFLLEKTKYQESGFPLLYLGTGLSLCWVAAEKWVYPSMSLDILQHHQVPTFGFAPELFLSLSAFIEFVVGYLLVVGILNRLLAVVLSGIFIMTTTLFGGVEIVGHFMIHVILVVFVIEGISFYKPPITMHKTKLDQMIFVFLNFIFTLATILLLYYRFA